MDNLDVDLEDLEVMLYSQVFYGNNEDDTNMDNSRSPVFNNTYKLNNTPESNRYYGNNSKNYSNILQPDKTISNYSDMPTNGAMQHYTSFSNDPKCLNPMLIPQLYMHPQVNNIVVIPAPPTQIITSDSASNKCYKRILRIEERLKRKKMNKLEKRRRNKEKKKNRENYVVPRIPLGRVNKIITFTNSDDDVQILTTKNDVICISDDEDSQKDSPTKTNDICDKELTNFVKSDKANKSKDICNTSKNDDIKDNLIVSKDCKTATEGEDDDDDVIYIPPDPKANEIINLDPDDSLLDKEETNSTPTKQVNANTKNITPSERKEMLSTPESTTSNDFLDNTSIGMPQNFNFSLHGSDFDPTIQAEFLRPKTPADNNDLYETESSCSATDIMSSKNPVFQEIDFESTKDLFKDNLENFGNYIVPKRDVTPNIPSLLTPDASLKESTKRTSRLVESQSDSSSESEYDGQMSTPKNKVNNLRKDYELPNLSPIQIIDDDTEEDNSIEDHSNEMKKKVKHPDKEYDPITNSCDKRKRNEVCEISSKKSKVYEDKAHSTNDLEEVIALDCSSISSTESSIFMLSELNNLNTDLNLANCSSVDFKRGKSNPYKPRKLSDHWKKDMKNYYEQDWDLENFTMENVLANMSNDPKKWKILDVDRGYISLLTPKRRRCYICRESGHKPVKCPKRDLPVKCALCGEENHMEPRCPNKICTQCGKRSNYSTIYCKSCIQERTMKCKICNLSGHIKTRCPDLWRRYSNTITETEPQLPQGSVTLPHNKRWCSACGCNGHYEFTCNYNRIHPPSDPCVKSYTDVYGFKKSKASDKKSDNSNNTNLNFKIVVDPTKSNERKIEDGKKSTGNEVKDKESNKSTCEDQVASTSATNIVIKLNNMQSNDNTFAYNRQFTIDPSCSHLTQGVNVQNGNFFVQNPVVYQLPSTSYIPMINSNVLPTNCEIAGNTIQASKRRTMSIDAAHARFFLEDIPGIDFIHFIETECNVMIKVSFDKHKVGLITIAGSKKNIATVKMFLIMYIKKNIDLFLIPRDPKSITKFLRNSFTVNIKNKVISVYHKLRHCAKQYNICKNLKEKLTIAIQINSHTYILNKVFSKSNVDEIKNHMVTLNDIYNKCKETDNELSQILIEQLKESFYFVYYKRRSLNTYFRVIYKK